MRTLFLLHYIDDVEVRKTINAATNKSEEFNGFVKWAFFAGEGIIAENVQHEQRKIVRYNQLVANLIILHNVEQMTRVLAELRDEGRTIGPEALAELSPYRTSHINRLGDYTLDLNREIDSGLGHNRLFFYTNPCRPSLSLAKAGSTIESSRRHRCRI